MAIAYGTPGTMLAVPATTTSWAVPYPATVAAGNLLVLHMSTSGGTVTTPSGWTAIRAAQTAPSNPRGGLYIKVATGSETGNLTVTTASTSGAAQIHIFTDVDSTTPQDATATTIDNGTATTTTVLPSITTVTADTMLVYANAANSGSNTVSSGTGTERQDFNQTGGTTTRAGGLYTEPRAATGASGTRTITISASRENWGAMIALRPSSSTTAFSGTATYTGAGTLTAVGVPDISYVNFAGSGTLVASGAASGTTPALLQRVVGVPGATSSTVNVKVTNTTTVRLKASTDSAGTTGVVYGDPVTPNLGDAKLTISGLTSGVNYYYRVAMTGTSSEVLDSNATIGRLRTAPSGQTNFAFNFGSCGNSSDSASMTAIAARGDDLFFHLGDLFYADASGTDLANFRTKMNAKITATNHAAVFATTPTNYTPSDHDGMNNNGTNGDDPTAWANWRTAYAELFPAPSTYYAFTYGRVLFLQIDDRNYKTIASATDNSSKTALGAVQKQWLKDQITNSTAAAIVIAQSAPWIDSGDPGDDGWGGYTTERNELAAFFAASGKSIVMLAGDMHALAADDGTNAPGGITLFQASPFYGTSSHKGGPYSHGPYPATVGVTGLQQYGRCVVTDTGSQIEFAYTGYSSDNTAQLSLTKTFNVAGSYSGSASLSGTGTLTAAGNASVGASAALSGSGALTSARTPGLTHSTSLAGSGTLTPTATSVGLSRSAGLSGSGTLSYQAVTGGTGATSLTGSGTLTASGVVQSLTGAATLSGSGTLTSTRIPTPIINTALSGSGTLTAVAGAVMRTGTVSFTGSGTLAPTVSGLSHTGSAGLSGSGILSSARTPSTSVNVGQSGTGSLVDGVNFIERFDGTSPFTSGLGTEYDTIDNGELLHSPPALTHRVRYRTVSSFMPGTVISARVKAAASTPRLVGVSFVNADNSGQTYNVLMDTRNGSGSTAGFQIRDGTGTVNVEGVVPTQLVLEETWYRITATLGLDGTITGTLRTDDGVLIATANRTPTLYTFTSFLPGVYGYGDNRTDDFTVVPNTVTLIGASGSVALTGSGTLTHAVIANSATTAALSGSGTLSTQVATHAVANVATSGSGTLGLSAIGVVVTKAVPLTGAGSLGGSAIGMGHTSSVALSGSGLLSAATSTQGAVTALFSGAGTLSVAVTGVMRTGAATLTGSGTLNSITSGLSISRAVALSGVGTLSSALIANTVGSATLSGSGALATAGTGTAIVAASLSGSGTLSTSGTQTAIVASRSFSGSGTLTAVASGMSHSRTAALSGSGFLGISNATEGSASVSLSGSGTLSPAVVTNILRSAGFSGSGALTSVATISASRAAALSGSGTLSIARIPSVSVPVNLSGSGVLTAVANSTVVGQAVLSGSGTLSTSAASAQTAAVSLSGTGALSAVATSVGQSGSATLSGTGSLNALTAGGGSTTAFLNGTGTLTSSASVTASRTAQLSGSGTLTSQSSTSVAASASLTGSGTLVASGTASVIATANFSGTGALAISTAGAGQATMLASGSGTLGAVGELRTVTQSVGFSGSGLLSVLGKATVAITKAFTGLGNLVAGTATDAAAAVELSGSGTLGATPKLSVAVQASLTGSGVLVVTVVSSPAFPVVLGGSGSLAVQTIPRGQTTIFLSGLGRLKAGTYETVGHIEDSYYGSKLLETTYRGVILDSNHERFNGRLVETMFWAVDMPERE